MVRSRGAHGLRQCDLRCTHLWWVNIDIHITKLFRSIPPRQTFEGLFTEIEEEKKLVTIIEKDTMIPDVMDGYLVSQYASVTLLNNYVHLDQNSTKDIDLDPTAKRGWVQIQSVYILLDDGSSFRADIPLLFTVMLAPKQVFPLPINIGFDEAFVSKTIQFSIQVLDIDTNLQYTLLTSAFVIESRIWGEVYKFNFIGYDYSIQYAMARPPIQPTIAAKDQKFPVVIALHGSGVEADFPFWTNAYTQQQNAWILFPTGRTRWGFDWHGPSHVNVMEALETLSGLPGVPKELRSSFGVDVTRLVYTGHSQGGQGAWGYASRYPDQALSAVPASAYIKTQLQVPSYMGIGNAFVDPLLRGVN